MQISDPQRSILLVALDANPKTNGAKSVIPALVKDGRIGGS